MAKARENKWGNGSGEQTDGFTPLWPSPSKGTGRTRPNSANTGNGQGYGSGKRRAKCRQCGFVNDKNAVAHDGGDYSGDGGMGDVTKKTESVTLLNGDTTTTTYGSQAQNKGGGCAHCGSRNWTQ